MDRRTNILMNTTIYKMSYVRKIIQKKTFVHNVFSHESESRAVDKQVITGSKRYVDTEGVARMWKVSQIWSR